MSRYSEQLLYVISAKREMSWVSFKEAFDYLYRLHATANCVELDGINYKRFQTVRALDALGHCDFDFSDDDRKVYAAPPVLVRLPCAGFPQTILAGAREPQIIQKLEAACKSVGHQFNLEPASELVLVPLRVAVQAEDALELEALANSLGIPYIETPSAWSLLHFAASINDYLATLQWTTSSELTWKRQTFNPSFLQFSTSPSMAEVQSSMRLSRYSHPSQNTQNYYLWAEEKCTEIDPDWGRYARNWDAPDTPPPHLNDWWNHQDWQNQCNPMVNKRHSFKSSYRVPQRSHEKRDAAVRALILYPMNALVEDQLTRLRRAVTFSPTNLAV